MRIRDFVLCVIAVDQVLHHGSALKETNRFAIREGVSESRDAPVRVDLEEPWLLSARQSLPLGSFAIIHSSNLLLVLAEVELGGL